MSLWDTLFGKKAGKKRLAQTPPTRSKREIVSEWMVGDRIENRYEIYQILEGGMGIVYICYDHQYRLPYALKTFKDSYLLSQQMKARFIREAETWVALEKQSIARRRSYG